MRGHISTRAFGRSLLSFLLGGVTELEKQKGDIKIVL